jgi:hypothetical protein
MQIIKDFGSLLNFARHYLDRQWFQKGLQVMLTRVRFLPIHGAVEQVVLYR